MRTSNPALRANSLTRYRSISGYSETMTIQGAVNKSLLLIFILTLAAVWMWNRFFTEGPQVVMPFVILGAIGGLITAIITIFKNNFATVTAPLYALFEGLVIGGVSSLAEAAYPGIAFQAVVLTIGTLVALLFAYKTGLVRATQKFKSGVIAATGGVCLIYMTSMILGLFHIQIPFLFSGVIGLGFSVVVTAIAALNLVLDFDLIEQSAAAHAPKFMEWYGAFALLVTLVWLYLEILRLLQILRSIGDD
ncbi:Bax inhibitor-1/YccA family protein [Candidatus Magnetomonas plexicatena]|uniref:Bax inhibitor-1/YccA family protein n=1 Tax=Candidatus Magnetomonas plexicatena TaxID=2552947 RepID=UPI001102B9C3|nr:Bax inhibitor-1/YccA family protein [Nitrospirales bacterium LBB_01]